MTGWPVVGIIALTLLLAGCGGKAVQPVTKAASATALSFELGGRVVIPAALNSLGAEPYRLLVDPNGHLWFALLACCHDDQANTLNEFDPSTQSLRSWPIAGETGNGLLSGMALGQDGSIWLGWNYVVVKFDLRTHTAKTFRLPAPSHPLSPADAGTYLTDLVVAADGSVWIARNNDAALTRLNAGTGQWTELVVPDLAGDPLRLAVLSDGRVAMTIHHGRESAAGYGQVVVFDPASGRSHPYSTLGAEVTVDPHNGLLVDGADRPAISVVGTDGIRDLVAQESLKHPPLYPRLAGDPHGNLWYAESDGRQIASFSPSSHIVTYYDVPLQTGIPSGTADGSMINTPITNSPVIGGIAADPTGKVWVSIANYHQIGYVTPTR